jgi:5S rRNA maturation endonuclease (ribonuclease M5)
MLDTNNYILGEYIERALGTYDSRASFHNSYISCRCPICGDSESNKRKKRGYVLTGREVWVYVCHNGDCPANDAIKATNLLKKYFPGLYNDYVKEVFATSNKNNKSISKNNYYQNIVKEEYEETNDTKHFIPILKGTGKLFEKAIDYCIRRKIPENIWKTWFVAIDGRYQGRMIIPFLDNNSKIYYYQGRTLTDQEPKYLNRRAIEEKECYNIYNVDKTLPVIVCEGPIDSMFIENSIATLGIKFNDKTKKLLNDMHCYYLFDNDKDGKKYSKKFLEEELYVFNWNKFLKDQEILIPVKDINDYILVSGKQTLIFNDLQKYFTNNVYDSIWFN